VSAPTIVYLHGFRSSPASIKATKLRAAVQALPPALRPVLHVPFLRDGPAASIEQVTRLLPAQGETAIVGSSLGGFYATWLAERHGMRAIVINPAVHPYDDLAPYLGVQTNLYTGEAFEVTPAHFAELRALAVPRITLPARYFVLLETGDEVLDYRVALAHYAGAWQYVRGGGDHTFQDFEAQLPAILRFAGVRSS
jgi:predicted esterase YcpF (UPF0227 family)